MLKTCYSPLSRLIEAAVAVRDSNASADTLELLKSTLTSLDEEGKVQAQLRPILEKAQEQYGSDDIEFDDEAFFSVSDDGCFVSAWVFVRGEPKYEEDVAESDQTS